MRKLLQISQVLLCLVFLCSCVTDSEHITGSKTTIASNCSATPPGAIQLPRSDPRLGGNWGSSIIEKNGHVISKIPGNAANFEVNDASEILTHIQTLVHSLTFYCVQITLSWKQLGLFVIAFSSRMENPQARINLENIVDESAKSPVHRLHAPCGITNPISYSFDVAGTNNTGQVFYKLAPNGVHTFTRAC